MLNVAEQMKIIKKGALEIIDEEELKIKLEKSIMTNKPLIIKFGLDPSAPDIHLGHTVVLRKIKQMQDLGHKAIIIIGDFTGRIGDPTGRSKTRNQLTEQEVLKNADTYKEQIFRIMDPNKTTLLFNSSWLGELKFTDIINITSMHTVARMLERDDFKKRFSEGLPIGIHEFFYPLMQAYDSLEINADIELGGTDQRFNILMGRDMQAKNGREKQIALFMPLLEGIDGHEKMSKSLGNYIGINEIPTVIYEKVMTIPDCMIIKYFELTTDIHPDKINDFKKQITQGRTNPKNIKMRLAKEIVNLYHGNECALEAEKNFITVFSKKETPRDIDILVVSPNEILVDLIVKVNFVNSKSEGRRLILQGGVRVNDIKIMDINFSALKDGDIIKVGKNKFVKITVDR